MALTDADRLQMALIAVMRHGEFVGEGGGGYYALDALMVVSPIEVVATLVVFETEATLATPAQEVSVNSTMTFADYLLT